VTRAWTAGLMRQKTIARHISETSREPMGDA